MLPTTQRASREMKQAGMLEATWRARRSAKRRSPLGCPVVEWAVHSSSAAARGIVSLAVAPR